MVVNTSSSAVEQVCSAGERASDERSSSAFPLSAACRTTELPVVIPDWNLILQHWLLLFAFNQATHQYVIFCIRRMSLLELQPPGSNNLFEWNAGWRFLVTVGYCRSVPFTRNAAESSPHTHQGSRRKCFRVLLKHFTVASA